MESQPDGEASIYRRLSTGEAFIISFQKVKKIYEKMWTDTRKAYGLTQNEIEVMLFLRNHEEMDTAADIAGYCSMSRSQVCKSVEDLVTAGYIRPMPDQQDRRYLHLKLTKEAGHILRELQELRTWFWEELQEGISRTEMEVFTSVLGRMRGNLDKILPQLKATIVSEKGKGVKNAEKRVYSENQ